MPRLLSSGPNKTPLPPSARRNQFELPHSPFQQLVESARVRQDLSWNDLAEATGKHKSTVWAWIHNRTGFPAPHSYTEETLKLLAAALKIELADLKQAIDASRILFGTPDPVPPDVMEAWSTLEQAVDQVGKRYVQKSWILNLIRRLRPQQPAAAAKPAKPQRNSAK